MYEYLLLNFMIIFFPFILSFEKKLKFYTRWRALGISYLTAGIFFMVWDVLATEAGHWEFNEKYVMGWKLLGLPIEEILFFVTVPYACLFTYESISYYIKEREIPFNRWLFILSGVALFISGLFFNEQGYTLAVTIITGAVLLYLGIWCVNISRSRRYWTYIIITLALFFLFNMILTFLPVVTYDPRHIWGGNGKWNGRFYSIPIEDTLYNFSMLTIFLLVYLKFRKERTDSKDKE